MSAPFRLDRFLIRLTGPDAVSFLDALVTQDLARLDQAACVYAALLTPQGKLFADMIIWREKEGVLIDADPARGPALLQKLSMHKLRANLTLADVSQELAIVWDGEGAPDPRLPALSPRRIATRSEAETLADGSDQLADRMLELGVPDPGSRWRH